MQKCFVISLHRTGTRSTVNLLKALGMRTAHYADFYGLQKAVTGRETDHDHLLDVMKPVIDSVDAVADVPFPVLYPLLAREYPAAKFILLHRDPCDWAMSVRAHSGKRPLQEFERAQYWHYFPSRPARVRDIAMRRLMRMHIQHTLDVSAFFERFGSARLLRAPLASPDTASAMARFLGYRYQPKVMPHVRTKIERPQYLRDRLSAPLLRLLVKDVSIVDDP